MSKKKQRKAARKAAGIPDPKKYRAAKEASGNSMVFGIVMTLAALAIAVFVTIYMSGVF